MHQLWKDSVYADHPSPVQSCARSFANPFVRCLEMPSVLGGGGAASSNDKDEVATPKDGSPPEAFCAGTFWVGMISIKLKEGMTSIKLKELWIGTNSIK